MPGIGSRGAECLGGGATETHPGEGGGAGYATVAGGAGGGPTKSGWTPLAGRTCGGRTDEAGRTPVDGRAPKCLGRGRLDDLTGDDIPPQGEGGGAVVEVKYEPSGCRMGFFGWDFPKVSNTRCLRTEGMARLTGSALLPCNIRRALEMERQGKKDIRSSSEKVNG